MILAALFQPNPNKTLMIEAEVLLLRTSTRTKIFFRGVIVL